MPITITQNERMVTGKVLLKCRSGEPITTYELVISIRVLTHVIPILRAFGERYALATNELQCRLTMLEQFQDSRKRDK